MQGITAMEVPDKIRTEKAADEFRTVDRAMTRICQLPIANC